MKRTFAQAFLAAGFLLFLSQDAHAYGINTLGEVNLSMGAGGSQAVLVATSPQTSEATVKTATYTGVLHSILNTASTASVNKAAMDSKSAGTGNSTSAINTGRVPNATDGTPNKPATLSGGHVRIGTTTPPIDMKADINGSPKAAATGNKPCKPSDVGAMRYNGTGNYMELCSYP